MEFQKLAHELAMHVAAMKPEYMSKEEIDEEARKTISEVFAKETANSDKPEEIKKKMLEGKIATFYFKEGQTIKVGDVLVVIGEKGETFEKSRFHVGS